MPLKTRDPSTPEPQAQTFAPARKLPPGIFDLMGVDGDRRREIVGRIAYGERIPDEVPVVDLLAMVRIAPDENDQVMTRYQQRITSPLSAIRAKCVDCSGGSPKNVKDCANVSCPLWAFRMGRNPFFGKMTERTTGDTE